MVNIQLAFIDSRLEAQQELVSGLLEGIEVIRLEPSQDGIAQITAVLGQYIDKAITVHIISHGAPGCVYLGNSQLNLDTFSHYAQQLQQWFSPLGRVSSNLFIYGCQVAVGDAGAEFLAKLRALTGANIAASANLTGNAALGGDWELEVTLGENNFTSAFSSEVMVAYPSVFLSGQYSSWNDLSKAIPPQSAISGITLQMLKGFFIAVNSSLTVEILTNGIKATYPGDVSVNTLLTNFSLESVPNIALFDKSITNPILLVDFNTSTPTYSLSGIIGGKLFRFDLKRQSDKISAIKVTYDGDVNIADMLDGLPDVKALAEQITLPLTSPSFEMRELDTATPNYEASGKLNFGINDGKDNFLDFIKDDLQINDLKLTIIKDLSKGKASITGSLGTNIELFKEGDFSAILTGANLTLGLEKGEPIVGIGAGLTLKGYDPLQDGEPDLKLSGGLTLDPTSLTGKFQLDPIGSWKNPFGLPNTELRNIAFQLGGTYVTPYVSKLGFIGDLKFGNFDLKSAFLVDTKKPQNNALELTANQPVRLVDLWSGPVGSYGLNQAATQSTIIKDALTFLNTIVDVSVVSVDGPDAGTELDPLIKFVPAEKTKIGETTLEQGIGIHGQLNAWGETATLNIDANPYASIPTLTGSLSVSEIDLGFLQLSGANDQNLDFAFNATLKEQYLKGDGKLKILGQEIAKADFQVTATSIEIKQFNLNFFGLVALEIDKFKVNINTNNLTRSTLEGSAKVKLFGQDLVAASIKISDGKLAVTTSLGVNAGDFGNIQASLSLFIGSDLNSSGASLGYEAFGKKITLSTSLNFLNDIPSLVINGIADAIGGLPPYVLSTITNPTAAFNQAVRSINKLLGAKSDPVQFQGTDANDTKEGDDNNDVLFGNGGNDSLHGGWGNDLIDGGNGNDTLSGGNDQDTIFGGSGDDIIRGQNHNDKLYGGDGNDYINGDGDSNETERGGNDDIDGGTGNDTLYGGYGNDTLYGRAGDDNLNGAEDSDILYGDSGNDTLSGGDRNDTLGGLDRNDTLDGGDGNDTADYSYSTSSTSRISANLSSKFAEIFRDRGFTKEDTLISIENIIGSSGNDTLVGDSGNNSLQGRSDNDNLSGGEGNDTLDGGNGDDTADYSYSTRGITADLTKGEVTFKPFSFNVSNTFNADVIVNQNNGVTDTTQDGIDMGNNNLITQSFAATTAGGIGLPDNGLFAANNFHPEIQLQYRNTDNGNNVRLITTTTDSFDFQVEKNTYSQVHIAALSTEGSSNIRLKFTYSDGTTALSDIATVSDWFDDFTETTSRYYLLNDMNRANSTGTIELVKDPALFGLRFVNPDPLKAVTNISIKKTGDTGYLSFFGATGINNERDQLTSIENIIGSSRNDSLVGNSGNNSLNGGNGDDILNGGDGNDTLDGGDNGNDILNGGTGNDTLNGGTGNDTLNGGTGNDTLNGDTGSDTADYSYSTREITANLSLAQAQVTFIGSQETDQLISIENIIGSSGNDSLVGNSGNNTLNGGNGIDTLNGGAGHDTLNGGNGNDILDGGDGSDTADYSYLTLGITADLTTGVVTITSNESDKLTFIENIIGSSGNDSLVGNSGNNTLNGGNGNDTLNGGNGVNVLNGDDGDDTLNGGNDYDILSGGNGNDTLNGGNGVNVLNGDDGDDTLNGGNDYDVLSGGNGNDTLNGGNGDDTLNGGNGDDILDGGNGDDTANYGYLTRGITANLTTGVVTTFKPFSFNVSNTFNADGIVNQNNGVTDTTQDGIDIGNNNLITQSFAATTAGGIGLPDNGLFAANNFHPEIQLQYRNTDNSNNIRLIKTTTGSFDFQVEQNTYSQVHIAALSTEGSSNIRLKFTYSDGTTAFSSAATVPDWFDDFTETTSLYYLLDGMDRANSKGTIQTAKDPALFGLQFVNPNALKTVTNISVEKTSGTGYLSFFGATGINNETDQLTSIEKIIGSSGNDILTGNSLNNQLTGGFGNDTLNGGDGNDTAKYNHDYLSTRGITADLTTGVVTTLKPFSFNVSNTFNADGIVNRNNEVTDTTQDGIDKSNSNLITQAFAATTTGGIGLPDNGLFAANNFHPEIQLQYRNYNDGNNVRLIKTTTGSFDFQVEQNTYSQVHIAALSTEGSSNIRLKFTYSDGTTAFSSAATVPDWFDDFTETTSLYYLLDGMDRANSKGTIQTAKDPALFGLQFVNPNALKTVTNISVEKTSSTGYLSFFGATGINNETDQLISIENITGYLNNDNLTGNSSNNSLSGSSGNDTLDGGAGNDQLYGDSENDSLSGGLGDDELHGWLGADTLGGGDGNDTLYGQQDNDSLNGGAGNDLLYGEGNGSPTGSSSNDTLVGGSGNDTLYGGIGTDSLHGESGDDQVFGEVGNDILNGGSGNDTLNGGDGDDDIAAWDDNDSLIGGLGNDTLNGMRGDDILDGGAGTDILYGGIGADSFRFDTQNEGIDTIKDFNRGEGDKILISRVTFGTGVTLEQFKFNDITKSLLFNNQQIAILENVTSSNFAVNQDITLI
jgi:Ca2+-binding RTX toxin-like protein